MKTWHQLALWADELRAIGSNGLKFVKNPYDKANYQRMRRIAAEIFALVDGRAPETVERLLVRSLNHYTPMVMGDALVINDAGAMLLIQRADSELWAAPGGALNVGETAAEGAVRECHEETGCRVEPVALIGIYDSRVVGTLVGQHVYHLSFLCRPLSSTPDRPLHPLETLDIGWFPEDATPQLDAGHRVWVPNAFRYWRGEISRPFFDAGSPASRPTPKPEAERGKRIDD